MFKINPETQQIKLTRGDKVTIRFEIEDYTFMVGDKIDFKIYNKKELNKEPVMIKTVEITEECTSINIDLSEEDTAIGEMTNKPVVYWYEIELNDNITVIGYDEDGAKELCLYPEGVG